MDMDIRFLVEHCLIGDGYVTCDSDPDELLCAWSDAGETDLPTRRDLAEYLATLPLGIAVIAGGRCVPLDRVCRVEEGRSVYTFVVWGKFPARDSLIRTGRTSDHAWRTAQEHGFHPGGDDDEAWAVEVVVIADSERRAHNAISPAVRDDLHVCGWVHAPYLGA